MSPAAKPPAWSQALGIRGFHIGPSISPAFRVRANDRAISLALKSGNFGDEAFFTRAQTEFQYDHDHRAAGA